jgi:hypothetical protein
MDVTHPPDPTPKLRAGRPQLLGRLIHLMALCTIPIACIYFAYLAVCFLPSILQGR